MEDFNRIQDYLLNKLSIEDRRLFEEQVKEDSNLASLLEMQRFELETIDQLEEDSLRAKLTALDSKEAQPTVEAKERKLQPIKTRKINWAMWAVAASILFIVGFFQLQNRNNSNSFLTADVYQKANVEYDLMGVRSDKEDATVFEPSIIKILQTRDESNVEEAINYFSTFSSNSPREQIKVKMNLAHAYILNKNYTKAQEILEPLLQSNSLSTREKEEVEFFIAFSAYKIDRKVGITSLQKISDQGYRFAPIAKEIIGH